MQFGVLGNLELRRDGVEIVLGSYKQRSLLALLLMHANEVVSADRMIDEIWGDEFVPGRQNALWVHVSNLRSALEPERLRRSDGTLLLTRAPGYVLAVEPDAIDASRFERLVAEGRRLLDIDPEAASLALGEGLALWRGRPYADVTYESFAQLEISRLDELRLAAVELRIEADLRRGLATELVGELEGLATQHPLRERLTELWMLALYRAGRQSEALRAFDGLRSKLDDELGVEPSPAIAELARRIVTGDRSLEHARQPTGAGARLAVRGYEVREALVDSNLGTTYRAYQPAVGREVAITVLGPEVANDPDFIRRFEAETELIARLEHPHIVPLYDYWREPNAAYLVMRDVGGTTLADAIGRQPFDEAQALRVIEDIGSALALAHRCGVVHGALAPCSIVIGSDGTAYLRDFAIVLDDASELARGHSAASLFAAPERRHGAPATPRSDTYGLATVFAYALTGLEPTADGPPRVPGRFADVITRATSPTPNARFTDASALVEAVQAVGGSVRNHRHVDAANPFKGLRPFAESDAAEFFGRERVVERLLTRLGESGGRGRFLAVVGPSGCGKSSTVHAGLLPALRSGAIPGSESWFVSGFRPGSEPFRELESALRKVAVDPPDDLLDDLADGDDGMRRTLLRMFPDDSVLLLVIDQFEELFTQAEPADAIRFLDSLSVAVADPRSRLRVVVTVRADFYDRPLRHRALGELVRHGTEVVTPMSPHEVERAVTGPLERIGVQIERGLVAEIVADVAEHPDALPLLQYALTELYDRRADHSLDLATYRAIGGLAAALARRAEEIYAGFDASGRQATRQVLLRMVTIGDTSDALRRRVTRRELVALGGPEVDAVLERLGHHRLLSFDHDRSTRVPTVAIAHEALLTEWQRLREWIDASRDELRLDHQLTRAASDWDAAGQHTDFLVVGARLDQFLAWAATTDLAVAPRQRALLIASAARRDDVVAAERERERERSRLRSRTRTRTRLLVISGVVLALTASLAVYAVRQRNDAQRLSDEITDVAEARRLASAATLAAEDEPDLAMLLALQSMQASATAGMAATVEAEEALHWSLQAAGVPYGQPDAPVEVRVGPNGPTGIARIPLRGLADLALAHLGSRRLVDSECERFDIDPCPAAVGSVWPVIPSEPDRPPLPAQNGRPLAGSRVTITGAVDPAALQADLELFREQTGIEVTYEQPNPQADASTISARGIPIDLTVFGTVGAVGEEAAAGELIDLGTFLDVDEARAQLGDDLVDAASLDDGYYATPLFAGLKGLVWYPLREFQEAGYTAPESWGELIGLSDQMVADGRTPWCMGLESEGFSGWPGTDWIEALVLRLGGVDLYDRWVAGDVPFQGPTVEHAFELFGEIAFADGYVLYGTDAISRTSHFDAMDHLTTDPPGCWMNLNGDWMPTNVRQLSGGELGFFVLPPIEAGGDAPLIGGAAMVGAFRDRPEVEAFARWLLAPEWGTSWATDPASTFLSSNVTFDPAACRSPALIDDANAVRVQLCTIQRDTIRAGLQRPDASDDMPVEIGGVNDSDARGAFLQGMLDYVDGGPTSLDGVLRSIDAAWPRR